MCPRILPLLSTCNSRFCVLVSDVLAVAGLSQSAWDALVWYVICFRFKIQVDMLSVVSHYSKSSLAFGSA